VGINSQKLELITYGCTLKTNQAVMFGY